MFRKLREALKAYVRTVSGPLAVRSSSKLEDSHYQPFAGIYSTYMIPYTEGNEDRQLRLLQKAIKSVYASTYFAASKAYVQSSQNLIAEEKMAVVIQEVCGTEQDVLFEQVEDGWFTGHAPNGMKVYARGEDLHNTVRRVRIEGLQEEGLWGEIL